jgi:AraC family transcriptional activator of tynA and feaB
MTVLPCDREWSTDLIEPRERFAFWREAVLEALLPLDLEKKPGFAFSGKMIAHAVGATRAVHGFGVPHLVVRTRGNIARSREQFFHLLCPRKGSLVLQQLDRSTMVSRGECGLLSSDEPFLMDFLAHNELMSVQIPQEMLTRRMPAIRDATAINFARETATGNALAEFAQSLPHNRLRAKPSGMVALPTPCLI